MKHNRPSFLNYLLLCILSAGASLAIDAATLRPPAVPLVACDPYFSIWSQGDQLTDVDTTHWTGKPHRLTSLARIDGESFRLMGAKPDDIPALPQESVEVLPTRTIYTFSNKAVRLTLTFMTADLPEDLDLLSRPVTYLTWTAQSLDGGTHAVSIYFDAALRNCRKHARSSRHLQERRHRRGRAWRVGTVEQPVLKKKGDDIRIDWGYFYVATRQRPARRHSPSPRPRRRAPIYYGQRKTSRPGAGRDAAKQCAQ